MRQTHKGEQFCSSQNGRGGGGMQPAASCFGEKKTRKQLVSHTSRTSFPTDSRAYAPSFTWAYFSPKPIGWRISPPGQIPRRSSSADFKALALSTKMPVTSDPPRDGTSRSMWLVLIGVVILRFRNPPTSLDAKTFDGTSLGWGSTLNTHDPTQSRLQQKSHTVPGCCVSVCFCGCSSVLLLDGVHVSPI